MHDHPRPRAGVAQEQRDGVVDAGKARGVVGLGGGQPRAGGAGVAEPTADQHLGQRVRDAKLALEANRDGEVVGGDLEARLGHAAKVRARQDGTESEK